VHRDIGQHDHRQALHDRGMVGFAGHLTIAMTWRSRLQPGERVHQAAGSYSSSMPTQESRIWRRMVANLRRLAKQEHG